MATLKFILYKYAELKDGGFKIKLVLSHKGGTSYISTRFVLDNERQWSNGAVVKRPDASTINMTLRGMLDRYQIALDAIRNQNAYSCSQLKKLVVQRIECSNCQTFDKVASKYIDELETDGRKGYASMLDLSRRYFNSFIGSDYLMCDISTSTIQSFKKWLKSNTNANETTINKYLAHTKVIINYAITMKYVSYETHPFVSTRITKAPAREEDISLESLVKIKDAQFDTRRETVSRDLFMLSFYLGGVNLIDIVNTEFNGDYFEYVRTKTKLRNSLKYVVPICPQAREIIERWKNKRTNKLDFGYKFSYRNFLRFIGHGMTSIKQKLSINETLVFYSARNTFSQFAADLGIPSQIIDYCLGHSVSNLGTNAYYIKVKKQQASIAISRVVDYIEHPDKYDDFIKLRQDIMVAKL